MNKSDLQKRLVTNHTAFADYINGLTDVISRHAMPGKWTPVQQLDHIRKSVSPVRMAFTLPKFLLRILFGKANRPSRTYAEVVAKYKSKLEAGGKAPPQFIPDTSIDRSKLVDGIHKHIRVLGKNVDRFSELELDQLILPHPLLGKVTLREMLFFTIYHVEHHHRQVNPQFIPSA